MLAAVIVALAISTPAAHDLSQIAMPAPGNASGRERAQAVTASGIIPGRITSLDTDKPLRMTQVRLAPAFGTTVTRRCREQAH
jgi:hypothetical protein